MNTLEQARAKINQVDKQMAILFAERLQAVAEIGHYKQQSNLPILDLQREQQVIQNNLSLLEDPEIKPYYTTFLKNLMAISREYQQELSNAFVIGFQGLEGAFSQLALKKAYPTASCKSFATFQEVFEAVEAGEIHLGILPFENSYTGEVGGISDLLYTHNCLIQEVCDLKIDQNLLGLPEAKLEDIQEVYSHPQAFAQAKTFLDSQGFQLTPLLNTAEAGKLVAESQDITKGAIASKETARLYHLKILAQQINTSQQNTTRFMLIAKNKGQQATLRGNRFSLLFTLNHSAGQLANTIAIIGNHGFNIESIRSKPLHQQPWQYYFYVEIIGAFQTPAAQAMLAELKNCCKQLKVIGIYDKEATEAL